MRTWIASLTVALALLATPAAAQVPFTEIELEVGAVTGTITEDDDVRVPYKGTATIPVTVTVGCLNIVQALPTPTAEVTLQETTWMVAEPLVLTFSPEQCLSPSGTATQEGVLSFTLKPEAPAVVAHTLPVTVVFAADETLTATKEVTFAVAYNSDYSVVADTTFPVQVRGNSATFNITVTQRSNARSMVMFEEVKESTGQIAGLASVAYDDPPTSKTFKVTFNGPPGPWTEAKVDFVTKGHYLLDVKTGPLIDHKPTSWTFVNAEPDAGNQEESPLGGWPLIVAVLAAALVASRRT